ncbi:MAG: hypothetical protein WD004_00085 [Actinomycetota bacterium]
MTFRPISAGGGLPALVLSALFLAACAPLGAPDEDHSDPVGPESGFTFAGRGSAFEALDRLCAGPSHADDGPSRTSPTPDASVPPAIAELQRQVADVRGLDFLDPVEPESIASTEMSVRVRGQVRDALEGSLVDDRSRAWVTIGVVPEGTDLRKVYSDLLAGQVIGYYDPASEELVFTGSAEPSPMERFTLAHELTHALDDQHFDLSRLDDIGERCREEQYAAGLAAVEGSAMRTSLDVVAQHFTSEEQMEIFGGSLGTGTGIPPGTPPFVVGEMLFPYLDGMTFMMSVSGEGGNGAVDDVLADLPVSTEQILHPELRGVDEPTRVDIPDLGRRVGPGWRDLDVMQVGEDWISRMLELELPGSEAREAAAGWDGGIYRAWSSGERTAVALSTVWDSEQDAAAFSTALSAWAGDRPVRVARDGDRVDALFASEEATLESFVAVARG